MRRSPHQLISGRGEPVPRSLMQHARAQGSKEDGTLLQHGFFQPVMRTVTHPPWNRYYVVFVLFQRFGLHLQNGALRRQTCLEIAPERDQQLACDCDDRNPPDTTLEFANTIVEPDA
jgi:hypothetical protein